MNNTLLGVDPGVKGALAFLNARGSLLAAYRMPTTITLRNRKRKRIIDEEALLSLILQHAPDSAWIEDVYASPQMGVTSSFTFGDGKGLLRGILRARGVELHRVHPSVWKRDMRVTADKRSSIRRAKKLFPFQLAMLTSEGKCEAALIGLYGLLASDGIDLSNCNI